MSLRLDIMSSDGATVARVLRKLADRVDGTELTHGVHGPLFDVDHVTHLGSWGFLDDR